MSLSSILSTSVSGLLANQEALRVTANNVANVNTPDYARQTISQEALVTGGVSGGVEIAKVERAVDSFLEAARLTAAGDAGQYTAMRAMHDRLQSALGRPDADGSLSARLERVFDSLSDLALSPTDSGVRQTFLQSLSDYTGEVTRISDTLQSLRRDASDRIGDSLPALNDALREISDLNAEIVRQKALGGDAGGLENRRAAAMAVVAEHVDVRTVARGDGALDLVTGTGTQLMARSFVGQFSYTGPGTVTAETDFPPLLLTRTDPRTGAAQGTPRAMEGDIRAGALRGLLDLRDRQLVDLSASLGELAAQAADAVNAVHNQSSAVPAPNALSGKATPYAGTDPHHFSGQARFAVLDRSGVVVADAVYDFDANPTATIADVVAAVNAGLGGAGTLSLAGGRLSLSAANADHGVAVADDPARPTDRGGRGFSHFFGLNDVLTARSPGIFETGLAAADAHGFAAGEQVDFQVTDAHGREVASYSLDTTATATFGDLIAALNAPGALGGLFTFSLDADGVLTAAPNAGNAGLSLSVTDDSTDSNGTGIAFSEMFGIGTAFRAEAAADFRLRDDLEADPGRLATARFDFAAAVGAQAISSGDNRGILALQAIQEQALDLRAAGELPAQALTLGGFNGAVLANMGSMAARVSAAEQDNQALKLEIDQRHSEVSGVNLDEELSNLVVYQNAYNAAARILSSVQELYDALLASVR